MLLGASLLYVCFGALMAVMAVLVKPISDTLNLDPFQMGTVLGAWQFVYLAGSIPAGAVIDRFGLRRCLLLAALIMTLSAGLRVVADSYIGLLVAVLIFGLSGPLITVGAPKLVARWFVGVQQGTAMGVFMTSSGVGALLATVLTNSLIMPLVDDSWRAALAVFAAISAVSALVWLGIVSLPASRLEDTEKSDGRNRLEIRTVRELLASVEVRVTLMMAMTMFFVIHSTHAWLPEILRAKGLSLVDAGLWAGLPAVVSIVAGLIVPRLALPRRRQAILTAVATIGIAAAILLDVEPALLLALCLIGIGFPLSCLVPIAMLMLMEHRDLRSDHLGFAGGLFFTAGQIGGVSGPLVCGLAISLTGNYSTPLWLMAAALVILLLLVGSLRRPR